MLSARKNIINKYGADTARLFILFAAPPERELDWSDAGVEGSYRFLNRVWRLVYEHSGEIYRHRMHFEVKTKEDKSLNYMLNDSHLRKSVEDVGGRFSFNTAISSIMELVNEMYRYKEGEVNPGLFGASVKTLILLLSPFIPHVAAEMWEHLGSEGALHEQPWPEYDEKALVKDSIEIVVQINGKNEKIR